MEKATIPYMFEESVDKFADYTYVWEKKNSPVYKEYSYKDIKEQVYWLAAGLMKLGLKKGDRVALLSEGRLDWIVAELGIMYAGGVNVPLSVKLLESGELKFRLIHSGCRFAVASESQRQRILDLKDDLPDLDFFISLDDMENNQDDEFTLKEIKRMGKEFLESEPDAFVAGWQAIEEEDLAVISYTSGTTSNPKGIMLMHKNFVANVNQISQVFDLRPGEKIFLVIPWDHSFAHTAGLYATMRMGAGIAPVDFGKSPIDALRNFPKNVKEVKPEYFLSVPVLSENLKKNIIKGIKIKGPKVYKLFRKALKTAYRYNKNGWDKGKTIKQKLLKPQLVLYEKILFKKIREQLGGRLKFFVGGGAVLDTGLQRFFYALGMPIYQGYGLTEAAPVISANVPQAHKLGSSGQPLPDLEVKIVDENDNELPAGSKGEILVRGDNVMKGYWKNENATEEALNDGWLRTGDLGYLDEDNFLYVLGRVKSLLISSNGEKYSPESIEESFINNSNIIEQILLDNDHKPYTVALIYPNMDGLCEALREKGLSQSHPDVFSAVVELYENEIARYKKGGDLEGMYPEMWLPAAFAFLGEGFTEQNGFLNSTMKVIRNKVIEYYKDRIDYLYKPEGKNNYNHRNENIIKKLMQHYNS